MTREETKELLMMIRAIYPNFNVKPEEMTPTINAWYLVLEEYPTEAIKGALTIYAKTSTTGFAPSVSQLIAAMYKPSENGQLTEADAWNMVKRALQDSSYHANERFEEFPETVKKAVGSPNMLQAWAQSDSNEVNTVIMSNFQRAYKTVVERESFAERIPQNLNDLVKGLVEKTAGRIEAHE